MSKLIKQMEMDALKKDFQGVRDAVVLSTKGLSCLGDSTFRTNLRKKKIRVKVVKNSLTRKVFGEIGLNVRNDSPYWVGPTTLVFGAGSVAELSQAVEGELKTPKTAPLYKDKVTIKGAIADGQEVPFEAALKMPTRAQAIGAVLAALLGPAASIIGGLVSAGGQVAGQIQKISEKEPAAAEPPAAAAAPNQVTITEEPPAPPATEPPPPAAG
jgi:large subunit ribosomal protein L10